MSIIIVMVNLFYTRDVFYVMCTLSQILQKVQTLSILSSLYPFTPSLLFFSVQEHLQVVTGAYSKASNRERLHIQTLREASAGHIRKASETLNTIIMKYPLGMKGERERERERGGGVHITLSCNIIF